MQAVLGALLIGAVVGGALTYFLVKVDVIPMTVVQQKPITAP